MFFQVNESDELTVLDQQMEDYDDEDINSDENVLYKSKDTLKSDRLRYGSKEENPNIENEEGRTVKKRKLSPIIYTRSPSPTEISVKFGPSLPPKRMHTFVNIKHCSIKKYKHFIF